MGGGSTPQLILLLLLRRVQSSRSFVFPHLRAFETPGRSDPLTGLNAAGGGTLPAWRQPLPLLQPVRDTQPDQHPSERRPLLPAGPAVPSPCLALLQVPPCPKEPSGVLQQPAACPQGAWPHSAPPALSSRLCEPSSLPPAPAPPCFRNPGCCVTYNPQRNQFTADQKALAIT